jgi:uncharacterized protein
MYSAVFGAGGKRGHDVCILLSYTPVKPLDLVRSCIGFDWDAGNSMKNWPKHGVADVEIEEIFFNSPLIIAADEEHSFEGERRFLALGRNDSGRRLFVAFTVRNQLIRPISARQMTAKELRKYPV